jgi:glutamate-ammonia-ligase adenylyltransferase
MNDAARALDDLRAYSHYADRILAARPQLAEDLIGSLERPVSGSDIAAAAGSQHADAAALARALRLLRQEVMLKAMLRDLAGLADLREVCGAVTALADAAIRASVAHHHRWLAELYGEPMGAASGAPQQLGVVGMGKLGGGELNVSSDVDLVFLFPEKGDTSGARSISNEEFFDRLARRVIAALHEATGDGFVFRVDTRLRPYGESGPQVCSLPMLEQYLLSQGRAWERYAWLKSRLLTGDMEAQLSALVQPFVFRKYLDFDAYAALRDLHRQISEQVRRRDLYDNIKLGPGGIREIEFVVQVFQLIRGGREPALRQRATMPMFELLGERGLLPAQAALELSEAYVFLRRLEHALQYRDDQQTHELPQSEADFDRLARALRLPDRDALADLLAAHRTNVARQFDAVLGTPVDEERADPLTEMWENPHTLPDQEALLAKLGYAAPAAILARLHSLRTSTRYEQLPALSKDRMDRLAPMLVREAAGYPNPDATCERLLDLLVAVSRRSAYLALLAEHPPLLPRVAQMMSASSWAAQYLVQHPILLDELLDARLLLAPPDYADWRRQLLAEMRLHEGDTERQMDGLRHFKHSQTFRLLARDVAGELPVTTLSDHLSALADTVLDVTLAALWAQIAPGAAAPPFTLVAYGRLGGKELGYASDLDLIFLYDDPADDAAERYVRLAKRLIAWLTGTTAAGQLYDVDVRLRPDGEAGLLVSHIDAFARYQRESAWVWEHQALTRARFCAGDRALGERFEREREALLRLRRDLGTLQQEVRQMRARIHAGHPNRSALFDLKHDPGGMVDIEFVVQYLVLGHSVDHAQLTRNLGNIALLRMAANLGLVPRDLAERAADAYGAYRVRQHALRLNGINPARVEADTFLPEREAVRALWREAVGDA